MARPSSQDVMARLRRLQDDRAQTDQMWQRIAEVMFPMRADFPQVASTDKVRNRTRDLFDTTAAQGLEKLASGLWGLANNSATRWFTLRPAREDLLQSAEVIQFLRDCEDEMLAAFRAQGERFYARLLDAYRDLVGFGTACFYLEEDAAAGLYPAAYSPACVWIDTDDRDSVDTVMRTFRMTGRQLLQRFPDLPEKLKRTAAAKPMDERELVHVVMPRGEADGRLGRAAPSRLKRFTSRYLDCDTGEDLAEGGYDSMPYQIPRWSTLTGAIYGESPGWLALSDARMLQQMGRAVLLAAERAVDPPVLTTDDGVFKPETRLAPGVLISGGLDSIGRPMVRPMEYSVNPQIGAAVMEPYRQNVRQAFLADVLVMVERAGMTATEVLQRSRDQMRLLAPQLARVEAELLDPIIDRAFSILARQRRFPEPPQQLRQSPDLTVRYTSPMARAQAIEEAQQTMLVVNAVAAVAQVDPTVVQVLDPEEIARSVAAAYQANPRIVRSRESLAAMRQAQALAAAQAAEAERNAQQAKAGLDAAKALEAGVGAAQQLAGGQGQRPALTDGTAQLPPELPRAA